MKPSNSQRQLIGDALRPALAELGGARGLVVSIVMILATCIAAFMPIPACYELWMVHQVKTWPEVPVRLEAVELSPSSFHRGDWSWQYRLRDLQTGAAYKTGDLEPGDISFSVVAGSKESALWSSRNNDAARYRQQVGQVIKVRRSPDGKRYFLRAGDSVTMTVVLALCAAFWLWVLLFRRRVSPRSANLHRSPRDLTGES